MTIAEDSNHLCVSLVFTFLFVLFFSLWGLLELMGVLEPIDFFITATGKWAFTGMCTLIFLPWLWGFRGQIRSKTNIIRIHIFKQNHGSLYGFLYAWSGAAYVLMKIYVLIALGILLFFQTEWEAYLKGDSLLLNYLALLTEK